MVRSFELLSPGRLRIREGGGCLALFGLPFFAAGVFMILSLLGIVPMHQAAPSPWYARPLLALMALAFTGVGGMLLFGRAWTTIDATTGTLNKDVGLLVPLRRRTLGLDGCSAVSIGFVAGDSDTADSFPLALKRRWDSDLRVGSFATFGEARACAAGVARLLDLEFEDATSDHPVRLHVDEVDRPFRDLGAARRAPHERVLRPEKMRSAISREGDGIVIEIRHAAAPFLVLALAAVPLLIGAMFLPLFLRFFRGSGTPNAIGWIFLTFITVLFVLVPMVLCLNAFVRSRRGAVMVAVSRSGIRLQERGAWRMGAPRAIAAADILDVDYSTRQSMLASATRAAEQKVGEAGRSLDDAVGPRTTRVLTALARFAKGRGITVKTSSGLTTFADGLGDDEVAYLYDVVVEALVGRR